MTAKPAPQQATKPLFNLDTFPGLAALAPPTAHANKPPRHKAPQDEAEDELTAQAEVANDVASATLPADVLDVAPAASTGSGERIHLAEAPGPVTDLPPASAVTPAAGFSPGLLAGLGALGVAGIAAAGSGGQTSPPAPVAAAAPVFTSATSANFAENGVGTAYTAAATPDLSGHAIAYSLAAGVGDNDLFNIDAGTGAISFKAAPDHEAPADAGGNNVYDLSISATEAGNSHVATQALAITVTDVADTAPTFTSAASASFAENGVGSVHTAAATPDLAGHAIAYSLAAGVGDNDLFAIDAGTGTFSFKVAPDFENPQDAGHNNVYDLSITATEAGNSHTATQAFAVTVTDVAEAPQAVYTLSGSINGVSVEGWKLIDPVTVNVAGTNKTFYYLDASGDGTSAGADWVDHDTLDYLFNSNSTPGHPVDTTDANRSSTALIPGKTVLLPTAPEINWDWLQDNQNYPTDLAAIWDAHNSGYQTDGTPPGWADNFYWSATRSGSDDHFGVGLDGGFVDHRNDGGRLCGLSGVVRRRPGVTVAPEL